MSMTIKPPVDIEALRAYIRDTRADADRHEQALHILEGKHPPGPRLGPSKDAPGLNGKGQRDPSIADRVQACLMEHGGPMKLAKIHT